ncbi:uncharacterized protein JCM10292_000721 [Rhodotorula paludigena]|uniref:uncharacterized protein n=1 Tax=Rhodotorula paludigena TaxID=86838 RepID=UPI0031702F6F
MRNQFGLPAYPTKWPDAERKIAYGVYTGWTKAFEAVEHPPSGTTAAEILTAIRVQVKEEEAAQARRRDFGHALTGYRQILSVDDGIRQIQENVMTILKLNNNPVREYLESLRTIVHNRLETDNFAAHALGKMQGEGNYRRWLIYNGRHDA